jgi:GH24 family phage-related lysozyme (muramidase)
MFGDGTAENPGFYGLEGKAATEAFPAAQAQLAAMREEISASMESDRAREMFGIASAMRLDKELQRGTIHSFNQGKVASQDASEARTAEFSDDAVARYNDPKAVENNKRAGITEVANFWVDRGAEDETIKTKVGEFTTEFHDAQIKRHLAGGDALAAQSYFDSHIGEIDGRSHAAILEDIARTQTSDNAGLKRSMREHITALDAGTQAAGLAAIQAQVDATPLGMNDAFDNLRQDLLDAVVDQPIVSAAMKQDVGEVGDFLATFRARMSSTDPAQAPSIDEIRQFQKIEKAFAAQSKQMADGDGLIVAANNNVIGPLADFNPSDPDSIAVRVAQAEAASDVYGVDVPPFTNSEVEGLIDTITGEGEANPPSVEQVAGILNNLQDGLGEDNASFMVRSIIEKNHPSIALALQTVKERPALAQEMIKGDRFLKENKDLVPRFQDQTAAAASAFGNLFTQDTLAARGDIIKTANGVYALRAAEAGESVFNATLYEEVLVETVGGIVTHNGRSVIPPAPGMEQDEFDLLVRRVNNTTLMDANGELPKLGDGSDFTKDMLISSIWRDEASLVSTSLEGTYHLLIPGVGYIQNADQTGVFELDLREVQASSEVTQGAQTTMPVGVFDVDTEDRTLDAMIAAARDDQRVARGLESTFQSIPEPDFAEEDTAEGTVSAPRRRPEGLEQSASRSKTFTAAAELTGVQEIPTSMYKDSRGVPTVGIGFNLLKSGAQEAIEGFGYNYAEVLQGKQEISRGDAFALYEKDYARATDDARAQVPNFDNIDYARQVALIDMAFNLGGAGLGEFNRMMAAIAQEDWELAAQEAEDSDWFKQVGRRGPRNVETLRTGELQGFK